MTLQLDPDEIVAQIRDHGVAGAGGAGFPSYAKWGPDHLMVNHQESEPGYYVDKWLGREHPEAFAELFDALLSEGVFDVIVIGAKQKDRKWSKGLEEATDGTVYLPGDLPIDPDEQEGVVFTYTADNYNFGKEKALLAMATGVNPGQDLPMDHGWVVHNTETLYNLHRVLAEGEPVTRKLVHVYGHTPEHRFLDVPVGTPLEPLLEAAGTSLAEVRANDQILADGGPGWCFEITEPESFGVRKRTNAILVLDRDLVDEVRQGDVDSRIDVLHNGDMDWSGDHETEPTTLDVDRVQVPLISNPGFAGLVAPSDPTVAKGDEVETGEEIAALHENDNPFSEVQHAPLDGVVGEVTRGDEDGSIQIEA